MVWFALGLFAAVFAVTMLVVWRRWIAPWKDVEEMSRAIVDKSSPRKFLISSNPQSRNIGLALELLDDSQRDLEKRSSDDERSVQDSYGAMPDGLVVAESGR